MINKQTKVPVQRFKCKGLTNSPVLSTKRSFPQYVSDSCQQHSQISDWKSMLTAEEMMAPAKKQVASTNRWIACISPVHSLSHYWATKKNKKKVKQKVPVIRDTGVILPVAINDISFELAPDQWTNKPQLSTHRIRINKCLATKISSSLTWN